MRPGACIRSTCVAPFVHSRPALAGCRLSPTVLVIRVPSGPAVVDTAMPQPTPQYEQTARDSVGGASDRSTVVPAGAPMLR